MSKTRCMWALGMLSCALGSVWAQDSAAPASPSSSPPVPAYGAENAATQVSDNPPISGMDLPSLEPHAAPISYLQPGATISESVNSNIVGGLGNSSVGSVTRGLGTLALRRLWSHYDLALDYVGGAGYYNRGDIGGKLLQDMGLQQKILWRRGELSLRDNFSYLPEGNFGAAYGSLGSTGIVTVGNSAFGSFFGGSALGALGVIPRMINVSMADISERISPKSTLTAAGGYAFTHFYGHDTNGTTFIGSSQTSAQGGYSRILSSHTQVGLIYGYQGFDFTVLGTAFHSHVIQGLYGHRISGRMDLLLGAGPQITFIDSSTEVCSDPSLPPPLCQVLGGTLTAVPVRNTKLGVAAQARLRYKFPRTSLDLRFERSETSGSGLFTGAQTNVVRFTAERPLSRVWSVSGDIGFAHNSRIQSLTPEQDAACQALLSQGLVGVCPANDARTYTYGFAGVVLHRHFGRTFHGFLSFQDNELAFDRSYCVSTGPCNRIANRQAVTLGLDWTPRPIRLD